MFYFPLIKITIRIYIVNQILYMYLAYKKYIFNKLYLFLNIDILIRILILVFI